MSPLEQYLRKLLAARALTVAAAARQAEVMPAVLSRILCGSQPLRSDVALRLATAFKLDARQLMALEWKRPWVPR